MGGNNTASQALWMCVQGDVRQQRAMWIFKNAPSVSVILYAKS